jgi:cellulose synthase/poly-beta-1,6-N-acetylglucosamine synthase-like glycosyltransferase
VSVWIFWSAAGVVAYTYALFPLLVLARAALRPRPYRSAELEPRVSVIVVARNEAAAIRRKLETLLTLDYPREKLEVLVVSDGSDDATASIAAEYAPLVRVLDLPHRGKAAAIAAGAARARGEILVFSDANSLVRRDALRALVRPFADPAIGGVAGDQRYTAGSPGDGVALGERSYWSFDRILKQSESCAGSVVSATGALYGVRRSLFRAPPAGATDDFAVSTAVIEQGRRLVFAPEAVALEPVAGRRDAEFARKVRVMTRGLRGVYERRGLLDPRRHGFYAVQLFSHKVLRRAMTVPLAALAATSPLLSRRRRVYRAATVAQGALYALGGAGLALGRTPLARTPLLALPAYFCLVNAASLVAAWNLLRGRRIERWEPAREGPPA